MPRNDYHDRLSARQQRLENAAQRAQANADAAYKRADMSEAATGIPFGQPILVGHHSEGRHYLSDPDEPGCYDVFVDYGGEVQQYAIEGRG